MAGRRVVITGMSGLVGGVLGRRLGDVHTLTALSRRKVPGVPTHVADVGDLPALRRAFEGQQVVVHLAAARPNATVEQLIATNVVGTYNVFEAAREAKVERVVFASSGATVRGWEMEPPYSAVAQARPGRGPPPWPLLHETSPLRPASVYGCTKAWGEALGRFYADEHGLSVLCLRLGTVNAEDRPTLRRHLGVWCSHRDVADLFARCIEAPPGLRFDVFFALSDNRWSYRDLAHAREVLGYTPRDSADSYPVDGD